jgi:hypothetical protein
MHTKRMVNGNFKERQIPKVLLTDSCINEDYAEASFLYEANIDAY